MIGVFVRKLASLGRDENGAVLMVTLALFLFMYLSGAGVFAIGKVVKDRVHLQNACDAAVYSVAVVQADTLSRIATINRAMAWTYVSMTRRQMDYIVYRWLKETYNHHQDDENAAINFASGNCHKHRGSWGISKIKLNGDDGKEKSREEIKKEYEENLPKTMAVYAGSFYSRGTDLEDLGNQIDDDLDTIKNMNISISRLAAELPLRVTEVVTNVLMANIPETKDITSDATYVFKVVQNGDPIKDRENSGGGAGYMKDIHNDEMNELRFLRFCDKSGLVKDIFGKGIDDWFIRDAGGKPGICRSYNKGKSGALYADWTWRSERWMCSGPVDTHMIVEYADASDCRDRYCHHNHDLGRCSCSTSGNKVEGKSHADNNRSWHDRFASRLKGEKVYARPLVLRGSYFGEAGTITVGLAKYNENPWYRILKTKTDTAGILKGIFAAFNPYRFVEWTWAFSSAKAGYRKSGDGKRDYRIYGNTDGEWNLKVDDWDAVFVPVRRAVSMVDVDGEWNYSKTPPLRDWIEGGVWKPLSGSSVSYSVSNMPDLPLMDTRYGAEGNLDWNKIAEMLYH